MDTTTHTSQARTPSQNWVLLADFTHESKTILKPVVYKNVPLTTCKRASNLLKQYERFSNDLCDPQFHILAKEWLIVSLDLADFNEKHGSNDYTINHVKNDILEKFVTTTPLRIVI